MPKLKVEVGAVAGFSGIAYDADRGTGSYLVSRLLEQPVAVLVDGHYITLVLDLDGIACIICLSG